MRIVGINYTNIVPHITFKGNDNKKTFLKPEADEFVRSTGSLNITKLKEVIKPNIIDVDNHDEL